MYRDLSKSALVLLVAAAVAAVTGCTGDDRDHGTVAVQPGAPGETGRVIDPEDAGDGSEAHTEADVEFLHGMIAHHQQAVVMARLVDERASHPDLPVLAERIEISQADEITLMEGWLADRGEAPPSGHDHLDRAGGEPMPGMLTIGQLTELAETSGREFDRRFLELMIYHHEGALIMVDELHRGGGGQQAEIFQLATHIDADQRIEIDRMRGLLAGVAPDG